MNIIETTKKLMDVLGVDLTTAKVMVQAAHSRNLQAQALRTRAELALARELLEEVRDGEGELSVEAITAIDELLDHGLAPESGPSRVAELEERCREHRAKRAALDRRVEGLTEALAETRSTGEALYKQLQWPVPTSPSVSVDLRAAATELIRQHETLILNVSHDPDCQSTATGVQDPDCATCTDGDLGPILWPDDFDRKHRMPKT